MNISYHLPDATAKKLILDAVSVAQSINVDELNCDKSFRRRPTNKTVDEIISLGFLCNHTHYSFIFRDTSFLPQEYPENHPYFDVGLSTMTTPTDYFLWIKLSPEEGRKLIEKYKLEELR